MRGIIIKINTRLFLIPICLALGACSSIPVDERAEVRDGIDADAAQTLKRMIESNSNFQQALRESKGCFITKISTTKLPVVGGGYGIGVLYERETRHRTYLNLTRADLGVGLGTGQFRAVILLEDEETLEDFRNGIWKTGISSESILGSASKGKPLSGEGFSIYTVSDSGAGINASARAVRLSVNEDLTGNAISEVGIPNTGYKTADDPGDSAPRQWGRKLPLLAQQVIDEGYDLPLPLGIGFVYANVDQAMYLNDIEVGINGRPEEPFEFVAFENAEAYSETFQLKMDAWVFPFMNVFAMVGAVKGTAEMDVSLDGNDMLEHLEHECSGFPPDPLCILLKDETITFPVKAKFSGKTYGLGTTLAGGWNNWFVTIPGSVTYADMDGTNTKGYSWTVTPRFGRVVNMGKWGNLALFTGGNYLYSDLTIDGSVGVEGLLTIDYIIDQKNKDQWNTLLGFNWDLNKHLSWSAEYNGFTGSREAFITSLTWRL
ncbi:hypothetical protein P4B35_02845 [Pontiellaceae bacterium B12227]|nr:hypothetical protein [Pontiellaceae bacterium B12227]